MNGVLELFSGIGGMHYALKYSGVPGTVKAAIDINPVANEVYSHNHPDVLLLNKNIQSLTPAKIKTFGVNTILMSPSCQPFTRNGKQLDSLDARTDALKHISSILKDLTTIEYILMENVKGFETSRSRDSYLNALKEVGFYIREFILSPSHFGVPNTRHRYFCLARKSKDFQFGGDTLWTEIPNDFKIPCFEKSLVKDHLENSVEDFQLPEELLRKRLGVLDIVSKTSKNSICFTKAYTHYLEGTGSIYSPLEENQLQNIFKEMKTIDINSDEYTNLLKSLSLRYFTPREVANLMCFPGDFTFPASVTNKQKYRVLGNSINVLVVGELVKILFQG
ncbi:TRDMT1 family protein [Megaselia abdita]